jgi:3-dehydroquinate synthase
LESLKVKLGDRSYKIYIGNNILGQIGTELKSAGFSFKIAVISNTTVSRLYGDIVIDSIKSAGLNAIPVTIPDGESFKDINTAHYIYSELLRNRLDRKSGIVALGGGVIGDIAGFAASTYMRGIEYVQLPTTLLAHVDSSVGGKTGVNHKLGKNMIGTFYQPKLVWIDVDTLKTLPRRELLAGIAEVIKYGIIKDEKLFEFLEDKRDKLLGLETDALIHIIKHSCKIKSEIVSKDEKESGLRAILNYGHTIGHAIETVTQYTQFLHGEAVAIGMNVEAKISRLLGFLQDEHVLKIKSLIDAYGLPSEIPSEIEADSLLAPIQVDKKTVAGELKFVLPEKIGKARIQKNISREIIKEACSQK